jgi:hypothetical protein
MTTLGNPRVVKRKNASQETKSEPARKFRKNEILLQFKALQQKHEALEKENKHLLKEKRENIEVICMLEESVKLLEKMRDSSKVEKKSVTVQTEIISCDVCEYPAEDMVYLGKHMHEFHSLENCEQDIECHFCGEKFQTKM